MLRARAAVSLVVVVVVVLAAADARAGTYFFDEEQRYTLNWGFDPYYSFFGFNGSLLSPQEGENVLDAQAEDSVYLYLLSHFFLPRSVNLELSVNPLPVTGVYLKSEQQSFYDRGKITESLNIIESVTSGFPEPGAVSLFIGNNAFLVNFDTGETEGIGLGGLLLSYGNYHIVSNELVRDDWLEVEAKVKGITLSETQKLSFSFRGGARFHSNGDVNNTVYVSMARSHLDRGYFGWSPFSNSDAEFRVDFSQDDLRPARVLVLAGKKMPSSSGEWIFSLAAGVEGLFRSGYSGALASSTVEPGWTFLLRPNISF